MMACHHRIFIAWHGSTNIRNQGAGFLAGASAKKLFNRSTGTADEKEARKQSATCEIVVCVKRPPVGVTGAFFLFAPIPQNWA